MEWWLAAASALPRSLSCRVRELVAHRALPGRRARRGKLSWYALGGLPGKLLLPGSCLLKRLALVGLPGKLLLSGSCGVLVWILCS